MSHNFNGKLAVVTCTRDRSYALSLCQKYIERQSMKPDLWIVASEGIESKIVTSLPLIHDHDPKPKLGGKYSHCRNLIRAIKIAQKQQIDGILIMEDDDWYREDYLEFASKLLNKAEVTGIFPVQYLHLTNGNVRLSNAMPFSQMGFTKEVFQDVIDIANRGVGLIDLELQKLHMEKRHRIRGQELYALSIKGMYGSCGVTSYHKKETNFGQKCDDIYATLKGFIGEGDAHAYKPIIENGTLNALKESKECLLFNVTGDRRHYGCDIVMAHLYELLANIGIKVIRSYRSGYTDKLTLRNLRDLVAGAQLIIVNGEGSLHHDNTRAKGLALLGKAAKMEGVPSALINSTLYMNGAEVKQCLAMYNYISVRESASKIELQSIGKECDVVPDLTFYNELAPPVMEYNGKGRVGDSIYREVTQKLKEFASVQDWPQRSIMHPTGKGLTTSYINTHARYGFVVTGRFHDVCFCINASIPFIALESNTHKISALLNDVFGNQQRLISPHKLISLEFNRFTIFSSEEKRAIGEFKLRAQKQFKIMKVKLTQL